MIIKAPQIIVIQLQIGQVDQVVEKASEQHTNAVLVQVKLLQLFGISERFGMNEYNLVAAYFKLPQTCQVFERGRVDGNDLVAIQLEDLQILLRAECVWGQELQLVIVQVNRYQVEVIENQCVYSLYLVAGKVQVVHVFIALEVVASIE